MRTSGPGGVPTSETVTFSSGRGLKCSERKVTVPVAAPR